MNRYFLGIDLGGTKIAAAVVNEHGLVYGHAVMPTESSRGVDQVVAKMVEAATQALSRAGISRQAITAVGLGSPGPVDREQGLVLNPPNLPGWGKVPVKAMLQETLGLPVAVENDANAAALGENLFGAGRGCREMIYLTVSTGIGAGIITEGRLLRGAHGAAGEVGHMVLEPDGPTCGCGGRGCWEALSSGTAIAREATRRIYQGEKTIIPRLAEDGPITARHVFLAQDQGDAVAQAVTKRAIHYLGVGVANLVNIFNPALVVIGGGIAQRGEALLAPVREKVQSLALGPAKGVKITAVELGELGGAMGAAAVAMERGG